MKVAFLDRDGTIKDYSDREWANIKTPESQSGISILDVFYCPHARSEKCDCMKPSLGLINQALHKYSDINFIFLYIKIFWEITRLLSRISFTSVSRSGNFVIQYFSNL